MTITYAHNNNQSQSITCSGGSRGALQVSRLNNAMRYSSKFYSHTHLGFWLDKYQFYDGKSLIAKGALGDERLKVKFIN